MPVFRWGNPLHAIQDLEREMDRWVRRMDLAVEGLRIGRPFPAMNLFETDGAYLITAEMPGCHADDLEINILGNEMTISGVRSIDDVPENRIRRSERPSGAWKRTVALPDRVDGDRIKAELNNGLLRLELPKLPTTAPRQIKVSEQPSSSPSPETNQPVEE